MNHEVIVTCALTGAGDTVGRSPHVPVTPAQIAASAVEAANAGAAVVHIHVRDPETGSPSRDVALYREVVRLVKESDVDVVINLTAGMGGDLVIDQEDPERHRQRLAGFTIAVEQQRGDLAAAIPHSIRVRRGGRWEPFPPGPNWSTAAVE